jgi:hypothetical protein
MLVFNHEGVSAAWEAAMQLHHHTRKHKPAVRSEDLKHKTYDCNRLCRQKALGTTSGAWELLIATCNINRLSWSHIRCHLVLQTANKSMKNHTGMVKQTQLPQPPGMALGWVEKTTQPLKH